MTETIRTLPISDRDAQTMMRALLEYEMALNYSAIRDTALVQPELIRARDLQERLSLTSFYPEEDFQN